MSILLSDLLTGSQEPEWVRAPVTLWLPVGQVGLLSDGQAYSSAQMIDHHTQYVEDQEDKDG